MRLNGTDLIEQQNSMVGSEKAEGKKIDKKNWEAMSWEKNIDGEGIRKKIDINQNQLGNENSCTWGLSDIHQLEHVVYNSLFPT